MGICGALLIILLVSAFLFITFILIRDDANMSINPIRMTSKDYNAALNKAYRRGYKMGFNDGKHEGLTSRFTVNEIRECFGLDDIKEENI